MTPVLSAVDKILFRDPVGKAEGGCVGRTIVGIGVGLALGLLLGLGLGLRLEMGLVLGIGPSCDRIWATGNTAGSSREALMFSPKMRPLQYGIAWHGMAWYGMAWHIAVDCNSQVVKQRNGGIEGDSEVEYHYQR